MIGSDYDLIKKSGSFDEVYYLARNADVRQADLDPLRHFVQHGWKEFRNPNKDFDIRFYLEKHEDVQALGVNPLVHYIKFGKAEGRQISRDEKARPKKAQARPTTKAEAAPMHEPKYGPLRRSLNYLKKHGLGKFVKRLRSEMVSPTPVHKRGIPPKLSGGDDRFVRAYDASLEMAKGERDESFTEFSSGESDGEKLLKLIAFYLPQFHPFPENDAWWGKGFTEWTNVSKAVPQFSGHYQPRLPGELGFYDLRLPEVQERQAELAEAYGLYGFAFHYYWFGGKRLLERPLDQFAKNPKIKLPFCICWANENWTRRWDGLDQDLLIGQEHSFENDKRFIESLGPLIQNPRYIKIDGRPLIIIYRALLLEEPARTVQYWRDYALNQGWGDPYFVAVQAFGFEDPREFGFDAALEFPPLNVSYNSITQDVELLNKDYDGIVFDYNEIVKRNLKAREEPFTLFRGVTPMWDNEARKPGRGNSFTNLDPKMYQRWLEEAGSAMLAKPDTEKIVFINAWNEWAEGAYLEPDRKYGYAYLQATRDAQASLITRVLVDKDQKLIRLPKKTEANAAIIHAYYLDILEEIAEQVRSLPASFDFYISTPHRDSASLEKIFRLFPEAKLFFTPNQGRDIAPFIEVCRLIQNQDYELILKVHTKKSVHRDDGELWRSDIFGKLLNKETFSEVKKAITARKKIAFIGPKGHVLKNNYYWGSNKALTIAMAEKMGYKGAAEAEFHFVAGSMFWMNGKAMEAITRIPRTIADYEPEPIAPDGTLAHVMERLVCLVAKEEGFEVLEVDGDGKVSSPESNQNFRFAESTTNED